MKRAMTEGVSTANEVTLECPMRRFLKPHPDSRRSAVDDIAVSLAWPQAGRLIVTYTANGRPGAIRLPPVQANARKDELWRATCFEFFIGPAAGGAYYEFNLSPSTQWAVYRFDGYRSGARPETGIEAVPIAVDAGAACVTLQATLDLRRLGGLPASSAWRLGLAAVIEETNGLISYWALAHPPGRPDFHHPAGFACDVSPAVAT